MRTLPKDVSEFLAARRIAVAGVSRTAGQPANAIYKRLRESGHDVYAVNPNADEVEGEPCYPDLRSIPGGVEAVMIVTHPDISAAIVEQCAALGIARVWFHRSFGDGSVSPDALAACERHGIRPIVGGCPMMYCEPVDIAHRCMRWVLKLQHKVPA